MKRKVLVTGASRGIGRAISEAFAAEQDDLYLLCRSNVDSLKSFAKELSDKYGINAEAYG